MRFADITGHDELKARLVRGTDLGRVSHAQLFTGLSGAGTLPLAVAYAQYLNCRNRHDGDSCGVCPDCVQTAALAHPDLHIVLPVNKQGKKSGEAVLSDEFLPRFRELFSQTGGYFRPAEWYDRLDLGKTLKPMISAREADEIIRKLSFKSFGEGYKIMLIWLPEAMNDEAANKILKILEEPWDRTIFLLVSERADLLLPTVLSRTQEVAVPRLSAGELESAAIASGCEAKRAHAAARLACGDLVALRELLAGVDDARRSEDFEMFRSLMRLSYNDRHLELIELADEAARMTRDRQREFLTNAARLLRESYVIHAGVAETSYLWGEEEEFCTKFAPFIGNDNIEPLIAEIESAQRQIAQNGNPTIVFTHFMLSVSKMIKRRQ